MAIAFDASSKIAAAATVSPGTWSHTCSGTNRILIVCVETKQSPSTIASITYGGVALTKLTGASIIDATNLIDLDYWTLLNPATGANTISVAFTAGTAVRLLGVAVSLTGVSGIGVSATNSGTVGTATPQASVSVTPPVDSSWIVAGIAANDNPALVAGTSQTIAQQVNDATTPFHTVAIEYRGPVTPAAATTMNTTGSANTDSWIIGAATLSPAATATSHNLTLLGVGK